MSAMKKIVCFLLCLVLCLGLLPPADISAAAEVEINEDNFPDVNFMLYVREELDTNQSGTLSSTERTQVKKIDVSNRGIKSLEGINYFTNIESLECYGNELTWLDVRKNWALTYLDCSNNKLEGLRGGAEYTDCSFNCITDMPDEDYISTLICHHNQISYAYIDHAENLRQLDCSNNQITTMDLTDATELKTLNCSYNQLSSLYLSNNTMLGALVCNGNGMVRLGINNVPALVSAYTAGEKIEYDGGWLYRSDDGSMLIDKTANVYTQPLEGVAINEENFPDAKFRSILSDSSYDNDQNGVLSDEEIGAITYLRYSSQGFTSLKGVEYFTWLTELDCHDNKLTELDVSQNRALQILDCSNNKLKTLDVSHNVNLLKLSCGKNSLSSVDVSMLSGLRELSIQNNALSGIDISRNPALTVLDCSYNDLTALDVSHNPNLKNLSCKTNWKLPALDVTSLTKLEYLNCSYNALTALNVSKNSALVSLNCERNQLTALDVSHNPALEILIFDNNQLTAINTENNPALSTLSFRFNQITRVDIQKNPGLKFLECDHNGMTELDIGHNPYLIRAYTQGTRSDLDGADEYLVYDSQSLNYYELVVDRETVINAVEPCETHTPGSWTSENYVPATCAQEGGYDEVQRCSVCGEELNREHHVLEKLPHTEGEPARENEIPASCAQEGSYDEVVRCSVCGEVLRQTHYTLDKLPHTYGEPVNENVEDATCTECGHYHEVVYCSVCHEELSRTEKEIPALGHAADEPMRENETPATCTEPGCHDMVVHCSRCGIVLLSNHYDDPALGHDPGEPVRENEIPATEDTEGSYEAVVYCTRCGAELSRETVTTPVVPSVPKIIEGPQSQTVYEGETVTFTVVATGRDLSYHWYYTKTNGDIYEIKEATTDTLTLTAKASMHKYRYWCIVANQEGADYSDDAVLTVLSKPKITTQPKAASVKAGKKVTFKVKATGNDLKYQWYYQKKGTTKWVKIKNATKASYSFKATKSKNGYKYRCIVSNTLGTVKSKTAKLTVK